MSAKVIDLGHHRWLRSMARLYGEDIARQFGEVLRDIDKREDEESCPCFVCQVLDARDSRRLSHPGKP